MSKYPKHTNEKCPKWEDAGDGNVPLYGKCCRTCLKQVRCEDNPDDFFQEEETSQKGIPTSSVFEVGKFYRICSSPIYPSSKAVSVPHLVVRKTKRKIVFECLVKTMDGKITKCKRAFHLDRWKDGSESACSTDRWSMIPTMRPDTPCEKPSRWDSVAATE